jgi:DNA-binding winged helix-turn-helix (wHTH) protein
MAVLTWGDTVVDLDRRILRTSAGESALTTTEHKALAYLAERAGDNVSRTALERDVWGFRAGTRSETVPVTMRRLRSRLEPDAAGPRILITVRGFGWRLATPDPAAAPPRTLPRIRTPFQDRPEELAAVRMLLDEGWTVVTLVGPGGIGKTRLAVELAQRTPGAVFASLAAVTTKQAVYDALMEATGAHAPDLGTLARVFTHRDRPLVVLDEAEDCVEALQEVLPWLAPFVAAVVVTSRRPVGVDGEGVVDVPPLDRPAAERFLAGRLAASRWRREVDPALLTAVVETLEGIPLALEVAAARPNDLEALVQTLAEGGAALPRMDQAIGRSWAALSDGDRHLLVALCLFRESVSTEELQDWLGPDTDPTHLADVSLVTWDAGRWRVLRTTRNFVQRQPADRASLRASLRTWLTGHARALIDPILRSRQAALDAWLALLPDMEAVVQEADATEAAAMASHLAYLFSVRGSHRVEAMIRLGLARGGNPFLHVLAGAFQVDDAPDEHLARADDDTDRWTRILAATARTWRHGPRPRAALVALTGVEPGQPMDGITAELWCAWSHTLTRGDPDLEAMRVSARPFVVLAAQLEDRLSTLAWHDGDRVAARVHAAEARTISARGLTPHARVRGHLPGALLATVEDPPRALALIREAVAITEPTGELRWTRLLVLMEVGVLYTLERDADARRRLEDLVGRDYSDWSRTRVALTRRLLDGTTPVPDAVAGYAAAADLRGAVLAGDEAARARLEAVVDELEKPPRLFLASLEAYFRRLVDPEETPAARSR